MSKLNKYQPSNGSEGDYFTDKYCMNCLHCDPDPKGSKQCEILMRTLIYHVSDPEYPNEWCYDENDKPQCTSWQKWDWENDGDPDDPDNPKAPPLPPAPNQLGLFPLSPKEITTIDLDTAEMKFYRRRSISEKIQRSIPLDDIDKSFINRSKELIQLESGVENSPEIRFLDELIDEVFESIETFKNLR